jgi:hypothetical protein
MRSYRGEDLWFESLQENDEEGVAWYRRLLVVRLSRDQLAEQRRWQPRFRENVGTHTEYDERGRRTVGAVMPCEQRAAFHEPYQKRVVWDPSSNEVVGWLEW